MGLPCEGCGATCCKQGTLFLLPEEIALLQLAAADLDPLRAPPLQDFGGLGYLDLEGGCVFLGAGDRCAIYADRPLMCRVFPLFAQAYTADHVPTAINAPGGPPAAGVAWSLNWCDRCTPRGAFPAGWAATTAECVAWFGVAMADFYELIGLSLLKDVRVQDAELHEVPLRARNKLRVARARLRAGAGTRQDVALPVLPPDYVRGLAQFVEQAYLAYRAAIAAAGRPLRTRDLVQAVVGALLARVRAEATAAGEALD